MEKQHQKPEKREKVKKIKKVMLVKMHKVETKVNHVDVSFAKPHSPIVNNDIMGISSTRILYFSAEKMCSGTQERSLW